MKVELIRRATEGDAAAIAEIYAPFVKTTPVTFEIKPPSVDEMAGRIRDLGSRFPWLVLEREGKVAGYAYASPHRVREAYQWSAEISIYVHPEFRRQGIASVLYGEVLKTLTLQGYRNIYALIALPNPESVALHERCGFRKVAHFSNAGYKLGAWHDVGWWRKTLRAHDLNPEAPTPFSKLTL